MNKIAISLLVIYVVFGSLLSTSCETERVVTKTVLMTQTVTQTLTVSNAGSNQTQTVTLPAETVTVTQTITEIQTQTTITETGEPDNDTTEIITKDASELALALEDFPAGWKLLGEGIKQEGSFAGYFSRTFVKQELLLAEPLICYVKVFSSVNEAEMEYSSLLSEVMAEFSIDETDFSDEGFAYEDVGWGYRCVFRELNVIGVIDMSTFEYGGSLYNVKKYAEQLAIKISS